MNTARTTLITLALSLAVGCAADATEVDVPTCGGGDASEQCAVFAIVNQERAAQGLPAYAWDTALARAAQLHAEDMVAQDYFDHESLDGRSFSDRTDMAGYDASPAGENIAAGQRSPEQVMTSWMNSPGHRNNILSERANEIGVGLYENHWVQVFGRR